MHPGEKSRLYHDLGELIRSGMTLPRAVEKLGTLARGSTRRFLESIRPGLLNGSTLSDVLQQSREVDELDAALFSASERAGRLEKGFALAAEYYRALAEARGQVIRKTAYPLFITHFAIVAFSLTRLVNGGADAVVRSIAIGCALLWGAILLGWLVIGLLRRQSARNVAVDRSLGMIPVIGGMRRDLALSRFSAAYDMQLEAGVNVLGALEASGRATASARYREAVNRAVAVVRAGETVPVALQSTHAFPDRLIRAFIIGEQAGRLDQELRSVSEEFRKGGFRKLELLSEWIPRLVFIAVAVGIGWSLVSSYASYLNGINDMMRR